MYTSLWIKRAFYWFSWSETTLIIFSIFSWEDTSWGKWINIFSTPFLHPWMTNNNLQWRPPTFKSPIYCDPSIRSGTLWPCKRVRSMLDKSNSWYFYLIIHMAERLKLIPYLKISLVASFLAGLFSDRLLNSLQISLPFLQNLHCLIPIGHSFGFLFLSLLFGHSDLPFIFRPQGIGHD